MDKKAVAYSVLLLLSLVVVSILLGRGSIQAVLSPADISFSLAPFATSSTSTLDQPREFEAVLQFPDEEATVSQLELIISTSTVTTTHFILPLFTTSTSDFNVSLNGQPPFATGTLVVSVDFIDVFPTSTTSTSGTLPSTLPGGRAYKGVGAGAKMVYHISWTPPNNTSFVGAHEAVLVTHVVAPGGAGSIFTTSPVVNFTILPTGIQTVSIQLAAGLNFITFAVELPVGFKADDLAQAIDAVGGTGTVFRMYTWNTSFGRWDEFNPAQSFPNNFDITVGGGYFISITQATTYEQTGSPIPGPVTLNIVAGLTAVGLPVTSQAYNFDTLTQAIDAVGGTGTVFRIYTWNVSFGRWDEFNPAQSFRNNLNVEPGLAYFISATGATSFTP